MITLVIVDCQNDFISGTMSVKGAKDTINSIKTFIKDKKDEISNIIFILDWHPYNHCSFKSQGGNYPSHCVEYTPGACVEPKLLKLVQSLKLNFQFFLKGKNSHIDNEAFTGEIQIASDFLSDRVYFDNEIALDKNTSIIICGLSKSVKEINKNLSSTGIYVQEL